MPTPSPAQSRAARGWLEWSQADLARRANVGLSTVKEFEGGRRTPIGNNLDAIKRAIEAEGVRLLFDDEGRPTGIACDAAGGGSSQIADDLPLRVGAPVGGHEFRPP